MLKRTILLGLVTISSTAGCRGGSLFGVVRTLAGNSRGMLDGAGPAASFNHPIGMAVGADGTVYVADAHNHRVRAIAPNGSVTTVAGGGPCGVGGGGFVDGPGLVARFRYPRDLVADGHGSLYVADTNNNSVRMIDLNQPSHPVVTLAGHVRGFADGPAAKASFANPWGIAVGGPDPDHQALFVSDTYNHRIRRIDLQGANHVVTTIAGTGQWGKVRGGYQDGPGASARFSAPLGIAADWRGAHPAIIVADASNQAIRRIDISDLARVQVSTLGGTLTLARRMADQQPLSYPTSVVLDHTDPDHRAFYAVDGGTAMIYHVGGEGQLTWLVGGARYGASREAAADMLWRGQFSDPTAIAQDSRGHLFVADTGNNCIRIII
jgi:hypothetical protein